jgi:hypothetical protein
MKEMREYQAHKYSLGTRTQSKRKISTSIEIRGKRKDLKETRKLQIESHA